jgi:hypothetical protein
MGLSILALSDCQHLTVRWHRQGPTSFMDGSIGSGPMLSKRDLYPSAEPRATKIYTRSAQTRNGWRNIGIYLEDLNDYSVSSAHTERLKVAGY